MHILYNIKVLLLIGLLLFLLGSSDSIVQAQTTANCAASTDVPQAECEALVDLYNATDGANWSPNTNWLVINSTIDVCDWYGVTCNSGSVIELIIIDNQLSGTIPTTLDKLSNLQRLLLFNNQLSGTIPTTLGNLSNLVDLRLFSNQLSGTIPTTLGNLSNLEFLALSSNQLTGSLPTELGNLTNLNQVYLNHNQLSGTIPASFGNLSSLQYLDLQTNQLSGALPISLTSLSLIYFRFDNTSLCVPNNSAMQTWVSGFIGTGLVCSHLVYLPILTR